MKPKERKRERERLWRIVVPVCKGHLPVTETNRTGYVLGGSACEREREAACRPSKQQKQGGEEARRE